MCSNCLTPVYGRGATQSGFLSWLLKLLMAGVARRTFRHTVTKSDPVHRITITDSSSGDQQSYSSMDDVPPEIRERIEALRSGQTEGGDVRRVTVTTRHGPQRRSAQALGVTDEFGNVDHDDLIGGQSEVD